MNEILWHYRIKSKDSGRGHRHREERNSGVDI
jgi:hypothetical protein